MRELLLRVTVKEVIAEALDTTVGTAALAATSLTEDEVDDFAGKMRIHPRISDGYLGKSIIR